MKQLFILALLAITFSANAQMGIGITTPAASAQLDVTSTTKGFLPPRMTAAARDAILSPIAGLMIYCSNCGPGQPQFYNGTAWKDLVGGAPLTVGSLLVGDPAYGGVLAYIYQPGDPGYDPNFQHGLVASTSDLSTGISWWNGGNTTTGATATILGTGAANTTAIITSQGNFGNYAARLCRNYNAGGFTDWFLPSKDELNKLYLNKAIIGGFTTNFYWTSSESGVNTSNDGAKVQWFNNGNSSNSFKYEVLYVRAVRAF